MADEVEKLIAEIEQRNALRNKQNAIDYWLSEYERYFAQTSNPLCVWSTIHFCNLKGVAMPGWVLAYLIETAAKMHGEVATADPEEAARRSLKAMGLSRTRGQESPFTEWRLWQKREKACLDFAQAILAGEVYKNAKADVARDSEIAELSLDLWLRNFFPGKTEHEEWPDFFKNELDVYSDRFNPGLAALLRGTP